MARIGYARVSTIDQDLDIQQAKLKAEGCSVIRAEKVSGSSRDGQGLRMKDACEDLLHVLVVPRCHFPSS
ncbi:recombinase family protein, partial [Lichenifustis flavocetrariae]